MSGEIIGLSENDFVQNHGHIWSLDPDSLLVGGTPNQSLFEKKGNDIFQSEIKDLTPNTTYYYRAYIVSRNQATIYGATESFITEKLSPLFRIDTIIREGGEFKARIYTTISGLPVGLPLTSYGIAWGMDTLPDIENNPVASEQGLTTFESTFQFESTITLPAGKSYLRPYLVVRNQVYYGTGRPFQLGNVWIQRADYVGRENSVLVGFSIGQKGYVGVGFYNGGTKDFWEFDPQSDSWSQKADFGGEARWEATGFSIGQKGYIGTGAWDKDYRDFWEYDPQTNTWAQKADFGGGLRSQAISFSIGQKGYIGTGKKSLNQYTNDFWEYDPQANTWTRKADFGGVIRERAIAFSIGPKGYVGTGRSPNGSTKDFWEYDPQADTWTRKADFPGGEGASLVGFSAGLKGYAGIGDLRREFWEYIPE
ncbi:MAG: hypothetical protein H6558_10175 [Lewinellaceae bacterium]|nr:hypothetical protein [Lewinellaceae bacterium]